MSGRGALRAIAGLKRAESMQRVEGKNKLMGDVE